MDWEDACNVVLGRKLCVWKELLQPLLLARAKVLFTVSVNMNIPFIELIHDPMTYGKHLKQ